MSYTIVGLGEILWDVFPDGPRFGGAPANFACSAAELSEGVADVHMLSAVGNDRLGREAIIALQEHGVDTSLVQVAAEPTGRVMVELDEDGVARYQFDEESAWDHLQFGEDLAQFAQHVDAVCFGTLGQRGDGSQRTISKFLNAISESAFRILDVNLRPPFYSPGLVISSLELADVLKLNEEELPYVGQLAGCTGSDIAIMKQLAAKFELRCVAVTRGAEGAAILVGDQYSDVGAVVVDVADTVGAGDAFTASMTLDLLAGRDLDSVNQRAVQVASYVCGRSGGTMSFPGHLKQR